MPSGTPTPAGQAHPALSVALGVLMLFFFVDGFVRDASTGAALALIVLGAFVVRGLIEISDGSVARWIEPRTVLVALLGTLLVGLIGRRLGLSSVFAAAVVGVIAGLLPRVTSRVKNADTAPLYVGAFAGMTSPVVLMGPEWLILSGVITGCLWSVVREAWVGVGGKMGTVAFAGVALTAGIATLLGHGGGMVPLPRYLPAQEVAIVAASVGAAALTHWLAFRRGWGVVLASALPTAAVVIVFVGVSQAVTLPGDALIAAWFGGSFVGMTATTRTSGGWWMLPAMGLVFGVLLILFQVNLSGLGGDLGATAAAAVIAVIGMGCVARRGAARTVDSARISVRHLGH